MKGYGQFCPIAVASEIVAGRWTPLILREALDRLGDKFAHIEREHPATRP